MVNDIRAAMLLVTFHLFASFQTDAPLMDTRDVLRISCPEDLLRFGAPSFCLFSSLGGKIIQLFIRDKYQELSDVNII